MDRRLSQISVSDVSIGLDMSVLVFYMSLGLRTEMLWEILEDFNLAYEVRIAVHDEPVKGSTAAPW